MRIALPVLATATAQAMVSGGREPPPVPNTPHVYNLEFKDGWKAGVSGWAQEKTAGDRVVLVNFFNPFCGHCRGMLPAYDEAARVVSEKWHLGSKIRLGRVNCDQDQKRCASYGISAYPTMLLLDGKGRKVDEFPIGLRRKENFLDYVAEKLRDPAPSHVLNEKEFWSQFKALAQSCRGDGIPAEDRMSHVCRAHQTNNVLVAGSRAIKKIRSADPKIFSRYLVWQADISFPPLSSPDDACWIDTYEPDSYNCLDTSHEAFGNATLLQFVKKYSNPRFVLNATWHHLFLARQQVTKSVMVVALGKKGEGDPQWQEALDTAVDNHRERFIVLIVDPEDDFYPIFSQLQIRESFPRIGALVEDPESHLVFNFTGTDPSDLNTWTDDIMFGRIKPVRPTWSPNFWMKLRNNIRHIGRGMKYSWLWTTWKQKVMGLSFLFFGFVGVYGIAYMSGGDEGLVKRTDAQTAGRLPSPASGQAPQQGPVASPAGNEIAAGDYQESTEMETREPSPAASPGAASDNLRRRR